MITWCSLLLTVVVQYTSAQAIPYGVPNRSINIGNNARGVPNGMAMGKGLASGIGRTMPIAAKNMARGNIINRQNLENPYYANNNLVNNYAFGNKANENLVNIFETKLANPLISASQVLANDITAAALENFANVNQMQDIGTPAVIANMPKGATYNFGNSPIPVTVTGSPQGNLPVGINILADNLEVKGLVSVVGRMPIFGTVSVNGNVPSDGKASVNYSCGSPAAV